MNAYTIAGGDVLPYIVLANGAIVVGEEGRGRKMRTVTLPAGAQVDQQGRLTAIPQPFTLLLIADHSGFRGSWALGPDPLPENVLVIAVGQVAQGIAGRMGGGPEYLLGIKGDAELTITRTGRLYGKPSHIIVSVKGGRVEAGPPPDPPIDWCSL